MATVSGARFRELLARATGFYKTGTASGGSTNTIEDDNPGSFDQYLARRLVNTWAQILSGSSGSAPDFEARRAQNISATTLTVDTAYSAAVASGDTYALTPFHPDDMDDAIQEAIRTSYPDSFLHLRDESLVVDNLTVNWDFETFSGGFTGWTENGSATVTVETSRIFQGTQSAKVVPSAADESMSQDLFTSVNIRDLSGKTIKFPAVGWSDGATGMKARVSFDAGTTFKDSRNHSGSSEWEELPVTVTVPSTATSLSLYLWHGTNGTTTVYWGMAPSRADAITRYVYATTFFRPPAIVSQQADASDPNGRYDPITRLNPAISGRILRLEGMGRHTVPTSDSDTVTIDESQAELIIARAAAIMFQRFMSQDPTREDRHRERRDYWESKARELRAQTGIRQRAIPATLSDGAVRFTEDATNRHFELVR